MYETGMFETDEDKIGKYTVNYYHSMLLLMPIMQ